MELWNSIRQRVLRDGVSIRQIAREQDSMTDLPP